MSHPINSNLSILFVDDEPQARKYFSMGLADSFAILTAASADEAEEILARDGDRIAVVITDQRMPGRTGSSLLSSVRTTHPDIVRILTTAYSDIQGAVEAVNKGEVFRYITKPWEFDNLRQEMRIAVQVFELQRDRDALLAEKLSVKMRLRAAERARLLIALSGALPDLAGLHGAVEAYIVDMASLNPPPAPTSGPRADMWSDAEAEAVFAKELAAELASLPRRLDLEATPGTEGGSTGMIRSGDTGAGNSTLPSGVMAVTGLLKRALPALMATDPPIAVRSDDRMLVLEAEGIKRADAYDQVLFGPASPGTIVSRSDLLKVYVLAFAANGGAETTHGAETLKIKIMLPLGASQAGAAVSGDTQALNRRIFQSLENWM